MKDVILKNADIINCSDSFGQLNSYMEAVEANWNNSVYLAPFVSPTKRCGVLEEPKDY